METAKAARPLKSTRFTFRASWLLLILPLVAVTAALIHFLFLSPGSGPNPVVLENEKPGSDGWKLGLSGFHVANDQEQQIQGYASATSVNKNSDITLYITVTPVQTYTVDVYRVGWYGGKGGRFLQHSGPLDGTQQPTCPIDKTLGLIACDWSPSLTIHVPNDWTSGVYLAVLTNEKKYQSYAIFVVRDDARSADLLYQQSVLTYQAYNNYPNDGKTGKSLYTNSSFGPNTISGNPGAVKVSFDRPYANVGTYRSIGAGLFFSWDAYWIRWLERSGYDVTYSTDIDTHLNGINADKYKGFLAVGHDEYWTRQMFQAIESARDKGVNLAFFGADDAGWQARLEPSASGEANRVVVCYRDASLDPESDLTLKTVRWPDAPVNQPEQTLIGIQYLAQLYRTSNGTEYKPYIVKNSSNWVYAGTGLQDGTAIPGIVGYEVDGYMPKYPAPKNKSLTLLSESPVLDTGGRTDYANSSIYASPSGAWVFAAGTLSWSWGLDNDADHQLADARIQKATSNILDAFLHRSGLGLGAVRDFLRRFNLITG